MADWSWKQAVAGYVLTIVNRKQSAYFTLNEVYRYSDELSKLFPRNRNVHEKIRQVLQRLRDQESFVRFVARGQYVVNLEHQELARDPPLLGRRGIESPLTKQVVRNLRLRDTFLAAEIKRRYNHVCQVCSTPLLLKKGLCYAEGHHLKPMGSPHYGPDAPGNIIILCLNHHVLSDRAAAAIEPDTLRLCHHVEGVFAPNARLTVQPWHKLNPRYLAYHYTRFLETAG
jgi:predicted restriction endonuclease